MFKHFSLRNNISLTGRAHPLKGRSAFLWRKPDLKKAGITSRASYALALCAVLSLMAAPLLQVTASPPDAFPLVTDLLPLPLSNQFGPPGQFRLTESGDVFFNTGGAALFHWDETTGSRNRILQSKDPHPGFPGSLTDIVGNGLQANASGHVAMVNLLVQKGAKGPRGIFIYDGTGFQKVAMRGETAPGTGGEVFANFGQFRINDSDQVAFGAQFEPLPLGAAGLFIGSPTGPPVKIVSIGDSAPGTGGGAIRNFQLIGFNNAGEVAFVSDIAGGSTIRAVFIGTTSSLSRVVSNGDPAPGTGGTFNLRPGAGNYFLNGDGDVAFISNIAGPPGGAGIWVGNAGGPPSKIFANLDPTGTFLGGTFGGPGQLGGFRLFGFNDAGDVLFQSGVGGSATTNHALFLKSLASPAGVVFFRNQAVPGGSTETFHLVQQAALNSNGKAAFLASLQGGPLTFGWFLGSSAAAPIKIVFQSDPSPVGGTFGLAGENIPPQINSSDQVSFFADILGPNLFGAFSWTPGSGIASVVNTGDELPAGANTLLRTFMPGASDDQLLFYALKAGGRRTAFTKPLHPGGGVTRIIGEGDAAPGTGGALWGIAPNFSLINDNEEAAFICFVIGGSVYPGNGLFTHLPGSGLRKVAASGDPAPGAAGGVFQNIILGLAPPTRINSSGQVGFFATISGSAGNSSPEGVFIGSAGGGVQAVARVGDPSPAGGTFIDVRVSGDSISLNDAGQVAFFAISQVGASTPFGVFVGSGVSVPLKVVAEGDAGPGGSTIISSPIRYQINNVGQVAYVAGLSGGPSPEGVFLGTAGGPQQVVALAGDTAPGSGGGVFSRFRDPDIELNNAGQVAFWAEISGSSATTGFFLGSATAAPAARLIEGQPLPGGETAGVVTPGLNNFIGENFTLTDSGEMSMFVSNTSGPNLARQVIASSTGALREFITPNEMAQGTGSLFGAAFQATAANSAGRFFDMVLLLDGPAKQAIFWDGPATP